MGPKIIAGAGLTILGSFGLFTLVWDDQIVPNINTAPAWFQNLAISAGINPDEICFRCNFPWSDTTTLIASVIILLLGFALVGGYL